MADGFAEATAVRPLGDGRYGAGIDTDWSTPRGANGGYLAAVVLRALAAEVPADKHPRSLTCHFLRPPEGGDVEVAVTTERTGRAVSTLSARLTQGGETCVLALAAFGVELDTELEYADLTMPDVPASDTIEPFPVHPKAPPIAARMEARWALGPPMFREADIALSGGWLRTRDPHPADAFAICQYTDAWLPVAWTRLKGPASAPTLDLTVHFRRPLPYPGVDPLAPVLLQATSTTSASGYFEEDTAIWAADGTLLAQSRQLALLRPLPPRE